jgi:3-hydroxyisobutyrate dehydrogenase-like beta-hydroxyacid dehydrogenase
MRIISDFARDLGCPTPLFSSTAPLYAAAMSRGLDARDTASVCAVLEELAGLPSRR